MEYLSKEVSWLANMTDKQKVKLHARLTKADEELTGVRGNLLEDVKSSYDLILSNDNQGWRRAYVRAVFASIEGSIFLVKQVIFSHVELESIDLSSAERAFLLEETYQLDDQGNVSIKPHYGIRLTQNIRFVWNLTTRVFGNNEILNVAGSEWNSLQEAIKVRNRITHPKSSTDLLMSDEDLKHTVVAFEWIKSIIDELWGYSVDAYINMGRDLEWGEN